MPKMQKGGAMKTDLDIVLSAVINGKSWLEEIQGDHSDAWMVGRLSSILLELIQIIGARNIVRLLHARKEVGAI